MRPGIRKPGHATVVAYVALFVALGGSSYAALKVGSKQIVNNSLRSGDIRNSTIVSKDVKNRSLLAADFKAGQLPAGPPGANGAQGPKGDPAGTVIQGSTGDALVTGPLSEERFPPSGYSETELSGTGAQQISPKTPNIVKDLVGRPTSAPGTSRTINIATFPANANVLSCTVVGTATSCDTGNASAVLQPKTTYFIRWTSGTPAPNASDGAAWSFRLVTP